MYFPQLEQELKDAGLERCYEQLGQYARNAVRIIPTTMEAVCRRHYAPDACADIEDLDPRCAERWLRLMQVDLPLDLTEWNKLERIYVWITEEDLRLRRFERVMLYSEMCR